MPEPIPDVNRDHQCYHYQAPSGERCGSPALKGEYYCYHHHIKQANRSNRRILIDPEITCMELPAIEDRASIFVALAAVVHRLGANTIDTRRAGQMIYGLQVALRALEPPRIQRSRTSPAAGCPVLTPLGRDAATPAPGADAGQPSDALTAVQPATNNQQLATPPATIPISKQSLIYFLRSRHCATCNAELFPAEDLTERPNPGAPPEVIEEARPALPAEIPAEVSGTLPSLHAGCPVLTPLGRDARHSHSAPQRPASPRSYLRFSPAKQVENSTKCLSGRNSSPGTARWPAAPTADA